MSCPIYVPRVPEGEWHGQGGTGTGAGKTAVEWHSQAAQIAQIKDPIKLTQIIKTLRDI